jgi:hypothetical protein
VPNKRPKSNKAPCDRSEDRGEIRSAFREHLDRASEIVSSWPEWKQQILGDRPGKPGSADNGTSNKKASQ